MPSAAASVCIGSFTYVNVVCVDLRPTAYSVVYRRRKDQCLTALMLDFGWKQYSVHPLLAVKFEPDLPIIKWLASHSCTCFLLML